LRHIKAYTDAVQNKAALRKDQEGADAVDLTGKVVVITGANSGLGKEVATYVAAKGAKLYMLCRSVPRAQAARTEIMTAASVTDESLVEILAVDVSELDQVRTVVQQLQSKESGIYCLVCNAGVLLNDQVNAQCNGLESTFASHLLGGTYLLTTLLLPQLQAVPNSRVVVVTSGGMYTTGLPDWNTMTSYTSPPLSSQNPSPSPTVAPETFKYDGTMAYAYAKRGQVVLVEEWAKQYAASSSTSSNSPAFVTVHPGWTDTPAVEEAYGDAKKWLEPLREPWQGAEGVAWLTAAPQLESGALYLDRTVQRKHMAGPFFTDGSYTKNTPDQVREFLDHLKAAAGI
jgi:dehydrogenase/reductase SDR family member 12